MFLKYMISILGILLLVSVIGYVAVTIKEKIYLSRDVVVIHNKKISQYDIDKVDARCFAVGELEIMTGDEIKIYQSNLNTVKGMVIGANIQKKTIVVAAHNSDLIEVGTNGIKKIKIISRYGKFLRGF